MKRMALFLFLLLTATIHGQVNYEPAVRKNIITQDENGVKYADTFSGSDIGAKVNAAYAACPAKGCKIRIKPQNACYAFSTPIVLATLNKPVTLEADAPSGHSNDSSQGGVCLNYTPTTATIAIRMDWSPTTATNGNFGAGAGIRNIALVNNGSCETAGGCGSSAIGLQIGGSNGGTQAAIYENVKFQGFGTGMKMGTGSGASFATTFLNTQFKHNTVGCETTEANEGFAFIGGIFVNGGKVCAFAGAVYVQFIGTHLDSNSTVPQISSTSASSLLDFQNVHFENNNINTASYINTSGNVYISGGRMLDDCVSAAACGSITPAYWITANSAQIHGLTLSSGGRVPTAILVCTLACNVSYSENAGGVLTSLLCSATLSVKTVCNVVDNTTPGNSFLNAPKISLGAANGIGRHQLVAATGSGGATSTLPADGGTLLSVVNAAGGVQRFTTTTTCSTAATAGANCQTAGISFPVAFAGTNYSVVCSLRGTTNAGAIQQVENTSSSQFKITIVAITAAAFTYSAASCIAYHDQ